MSELCAWSMIIFIFSPESPLCGFFYIYFLISLYNWLLFTWYKIAMKIKINVPSFFLPPFLLQVQSVMFHKAILIIIKICFSSFNWSVPSFPSEWGSHIYRYMNIHWIPINIPTFRPMAFFNVKIVIKLYSCFYIKLL